MSLIKDDNRWLAAADALADACDKHVESAACSVDHADWCETMEAIETALHVYREYRAANAQGEHSPGATVEGDMLDPVVGDSESC